MRILTRARKLWRRVPRARRAAEFDRAVAEFFMRIALEEAARGVGRTSPNPAVGAILVKGGRIVARGHHEKAGTAHAEVVALEAAGPRAQGADLYTTLEPCDHYGRTPPCSRAILEAKVRRVICASSDPNPLVNGKGVARLRRAGVEVITGVLREEADALNRPFFKWVTQKLPYVTLKAAVTLDGKIASGAGDSRWITGEEARLLVHRLRDRVDAILVGANTVREDDPKLTTRLPGGGGRDAARVVVDSRLRLSPDHAVFSRRSRARTVVATTLPASSARARRFAARGVEVWTVKARKGQVDLQALLERLGAEGMLHVLVEGGARVFGSALQGDLWDELWVFVAPKLVGAKGLTWSGELPVRRMAEALVVGELQIEKVGRDVLLKATARAGIPASLGGGADPWRRRPRRS
ncbi:MAG TPA: bifunctional diaminohydroxyphosphoribosylaminopyrimidine deaminase/5-amino-6-(5-phosphoribosylamino)uracil reductase RibD [Myxococcaceae bacterium]|jgi:diaminohydroxyphosphoribosylaminopyrimidine deaminase/5-amino-6-(5-phosphoribosylamino)uracil reductase